MTVPPFNLSNMKNLDFTQISSQVQIATQMCEPLSRQREEETLMVLCKSSFLHSHLSFKGEKDDTTTTFCNPATISTQKQKHNRPTAIIYLVTLLECPGEEGQTGNKEITLIQLSLLEEPNPCEN